MRTAVVQEWVDSDPKVREWESALARKAKATGKNYSRLLYLYWTRNQRLRAFKSTAQWLEEIREQQDSPDITVRRAWGKELEAFNLSSELKELLEEVKGIRRLLIVSLLRSGIKPEVLAKILGYKHSRSLSNEFPVKRIRENTKSD